MAYSHASRDSFHNYSTETNEDRTFHSAIPSQQAFFSANSSQPFLSAKSSQQTSFHSADSKISGPMDLDDILESPEAFKERTEREWLNSANRWNEGRLGPHWTGMRVLGRGA